MQDNKYNNRSFFLQRFSKYSKTLYKKGIHTDSADTQTKGKKIKDTTTIDNTLRERG
jgi:hypothetical protein